VPQISKNILVSSTVATASTLAQIGSGILLGIAEACNQHTPKNKGQQHSMLWEMLNAARDLGRVHAIASVLIHYGFGGFVRSLGMGKALERAGRVLHWQQVEDYAKLDTPATHTSRTGRFGPTFIKLGQILATRVDLFPPQYAEV